MNKKLFGCVLLGTLFVFGSCMDDTYDLNKGIDTDVKIQGNKLALPLGSLRAMILDSLLSVEEDGILVEMENGVYGISIKEDIDPITVDIDEIGFSIDPISYASEFDFQDIELDDIHIDGIKHEVDIASVSDVKIEDLNSQLPHLHVDTLISLIGEEYLALIKNAQSSGLSSFSIPGGVKGEIKNQQISCAFQYTLPEYVKSINSILLAERDKGLDDTDGALVQFMIQLPKTESVKMSGIKMSKIVVTFPEIYKLKEYVGDNADYTLLNDHTVQAENVEVEGDKVVLHVYADEMTGITHEEREGEMKIFDYSPIKYDVSYEIAEVNVDLSKWSPNSDDLSVKVDMDVELGCRDIIGETNPIEVELEAQKIELPAVIGGLEYVDKVEYVDFDAQKSKIRFSVRMTESFEPLELDNNSSVKLVLPKMLVLDMGESVIPTGVEHVSEESAFVIKDLNVLYNSDWALALDRIDLSDKKIENDSLDLTDSILVVPGDGGLRFKGMEVSLSKVMEKLNSKASFVMEDIVLSVEDASIITNKIETTIDEEIAFDLNEPVEKGIGRIYSVGFEEPVSVDLQLSLSGLDKVNLNADLDLNITLPPFLSLSSTDKDVTITEDNVLAIKKHYNKGESLNLSVDLNKLDFSSLDKGYLAPVDSSDGKSYLKYAAAIKIQGNVVVDGAQLDLDVLKNNVGFEAKFSIGDIVIKDLAGVYCGEIEPIEGSFDLGLEDDLDMLGDGNNSIKLAAPQIMLDFENSVNMSLLIDMELKDENEKVLMKEEAIRINAASYENGQIVPEMTKLLITSKETIIKDGYRTIAIPALADLLSNIPESITYSFVPRVDTTMTHHIDLSQPLNFSGSYAVVVPFEFEELNFTYSDTIPDLNLELSELTETFTITELGLSMRVKNTMPLGLTLAPKALDKDGDEIREVKISDIVIPAGNGCDLKDETKSNPVLLTIRGDVNKISQMDKIAFTVKLEGATETVGGIALRPNQGLHITNIAVVVGGDIELDMESMSDEE